MTDPKKQIIGRRSKASGQIFETWLTRSCEYYLRKGYAYIEKTPEPFHITGKNQDGTVRGYYEKKGQPDYKGILCDGTGIMFEAKHTDTYSMRQSVITEAQWQSLDTFEKFGAQCYVMVSFGLIHFYRIPWSDWKRMKELFGRKFVNEEEEKLEPYAVPVQRSTVLILEGVELHESTESGISTEDQKD